jgi:hypothetical protein
MADNHDLGNPRTQTVLLMIGIAALTLVAVWAVPKFTSTEGDPETQIAMVETERSPRTPALPQFTAPGSYARSKIAEFRNAGTSADEAFQEGARQLARGRSIDAYLLYFYAARQGHTGAALALGTQADPAYHDPILGFIENPDVTQAIKWYRLAANAGSANAEDRLFSLQARVERDAAQGDEQAQRLALLWR